MSLSPPVACNSTPNIQSLSSTPNIQTLLDQALLGAPTSNEISRLWYDPSQRTAKRLVDILGAGLGLLLLLPLLATIVLIIRLTSKGPIFFRQVRLGRNGHPFRIVKFRTMVVDAEQRLNELEHLNESDGGVLFKMKTDPRVTWIGRILRRTSLDELPQLWNVLIGQMSLVGPRPLQLRDSLLLAQIDPEGYSHRLFPPPGLTGLWQARGRSETGFEHMLRLDREYVRRWSLWFDLLIMFETVGSVVSGKGAC